MSVITLCLTRQVYDTPCSVNPEDRSVEIMFNNTLQNEEFGYYKIVNPTKNQIEELKSFTYKENDGKGIQCVNSIISYLEANLIYDAVMIFINDGDKIANYPFVETLLEKMFGILGRYKDKDAIYEYIYLTQKG